MAQFDVHQNRGDKTYPFVVELQADVLAALSTCVVAPLVRRDRYPRELLTRATVSVVVDGQEYVVLVPMLAAISRSELGKAIANLKRHRAAIVAALDLTFTGT